MELPSSNIKKVLMFSQKKAFIIFSQKNPEKILNVLGSGTFLYFRKPPKKFLRPKI